MISGSLAYDWIMDFPDKFSHHILPDKIHTLSVSFLIEQMRRNFGGCAGNIAYTLSLFGERPTIISSAGSDFEEYEKWLERHHIDTSKIARFSDEPTAAAYIITDKSDCQISAFHLGAMKHPAPLNQRDVQGVQLAIVSPGNVDDMTEFVKLYQRVGVRYIFDPGQSIPALTREDLLSGIIGAEVLIINDYEWSLIQQKTGITRKDIIEEGGCIVVTLGDRGSLVESSEGTFQIPAAVPQKVVDPTGAGDAYRAGFLMGMLFGCSYEECGRLGSVTAVYAVEKYGTQNHFFTPEEVFDRYEEHFQMPFPQKKFFSKQQ